MYSHIIVQPLTLFIFRTVSYPKMNLCSAPLSSPSPQSEPLVTTILLSLSINLPILGTLHKCNYIIAVFLCLAYFTQQNVFKVHLCCNVSELHSFSMLCNIPLHYIQNLLYPCNHQWTGCFHFLAIVKNATINIGVQMTVQLVYKRFHFQLFGVHNQN